ncbi:MAG: hypothetical protein EBW87_00215 [Burkholderiaceae bacterium]|nr:hypothetical protein [Burkholderiaceae bacterium]
MKNFKVGVIIPDRGDRPDFMYHCSRMIKYQTLQPIAIEHVNDAPISDKKDITWRYRLGYERLRGLGLDVIAFMENDDWYSPQYLELMVNEWHNSGRPKLFGTIYTIYFNIRIWKSLTMWHQDRASAMNTLITPDMNFQWCRDDESFTDMYLWRLFYDKQEAKVWLPPMHIAVGIKHGVGLTGGQMHLDRLDRFDVHREMDFNVHLEKMVDDETLNFYKSFRQ